MLWKIAIGYVVVFGFISYVLCKASAIGDAQKDRIMKASEEEIRRGGGVFYGDSWREASSNPDSSK